MGAGHRYVAAGLRLDEGQSASYVFPHDRVQQAFYSLVPAEERDALHLAIGRRLSESSGSTASQRTGVHIFQVAHQLNLGRALIGDPTERRGLALLDLEAALAAKRSAAYAAALEYLSVALQLTGESGWARDHSLQLQLHSEAAECAYLAAELERMAEHTDNVLAHGRTVLEKAPVYLLLVDAYTSQNRLNEALAIVSDGTLSSASKS